MIVWLEKALVLAIHNRQLAEFGGSAGVRDEALLDSCLSMPPQLLADSDPAPDLADLASSLAFGLAHNRPFVDGNKRTAAVSCETFLELNHAALEADDLDLFTHYLALTEGTLGEKDFANFLRFHIRMSTKGNLPETKGVYKTKPPGPKKIALPPPFPLTWSRPDGNVPVETELAALLMQPSFSGLLDASRRFGLVRVEQAARELAGDRDWNPGARADAQHLLQNLRIGHDRAARQN